MIQIIDSVPYVTIPLSEWVAHCREHKYTPVPEKAEEIQAAIERRAWTQILTPIMQELGLMPNSQYWRPSVDYLTPDDATTIVKKIREIKCDEELKAKAGA